MRSTPRIEAKNRGDRVYNTGKPCKHGHYSDRNVLDGNCLMCVKIRAAVYRKKYAKERCEKQSLYYRSNSVERLAYNKVYHKKNRDSVNEQRRKRYRNDVQFRLGMNLRSRLAMALKRKSKCGSAVRDLGCSIHFLVGYLESKFRDGMNWDNQGTVWHLDHIRPLSSFDLEKAEEFLTAVHYTNLQPLLAEENLKKGDYYEKSIH